MTVIEETTGPCPTEWVSWADFVRSVPPGQSRRVTDFFEHKRDYGRGSIRNVTVLNATSVMLYCESDECDAEHWFDPTSASSSVEQYSDPKFASFTGAITLVCRHCKKSKKKIFVQARSIEELEIDTTPDASVTKAGEIPAFGPVTKARLITLMGKDINTFLKGRRAESQGMGIGAFAYYRRIVEGQKDRLLDEIIRVAKHTGSDEDLIARLEKAKGETQFKSVMKTIKPAVPEVLMIDGHNPLQLLHTALSEGLHADTDEKCLEYATAIRTILAKLVESAQQALKDEAEIKQALSILMNKNSGN